MNNKNSNKNSNKNEILFFKCWRNIYIRNQIIYYLKLYRIFSFTRYMSVEEFNSFKFKSFIKSIIFCNDKRYHNLDKINKELNNFIISNNQLSTVLESIQLNDYFNSTKLEINELYYNNNIKSLKFGYDFNQIFHENSFKLPNKLNELKFGRLWNQELKVGEFEKQCGSNLKLIEFGTKFSNKGFPIKKGALPDSLETIIFGRDFTPFLNLNVLPSKNLKSIVFGAEFYQDINLNEYNDPNPIILPNSLTSLEFSINYNIHLKIETLKQLNNLVILKNVLLGIDCINHKDFPKSIETLHFDWVFNSNISNTIDSSGDGTGQVMKLIKLPNSIKFLKHNRNKCKIQSILLLNKNLKEIISTHNFTLDSFQEGGEGEEGCKLESMELLLNEFNQDELNNLPRNIKSFKNLIINFSNDFIDNVKDYLDDDNSSIFPPTITNLTLDKFDHQLPSRASKFVFPNSLKTLKLPSFNKPLKIDSLPWNNLVELEFGIPFNKSLPSSNEIILSNLKLLKIGLKFIILNLVNDNNSLSELLPNLEKLIILKQTFDYDVNSNINRNKFFKFIPSSIKYLEISNDLVFNKSINEPTTTTTTNQDEDGEFVLPISLESISINTNKNLIFNPNYPAQEQFKNLYCCESNDTFLNNSNNIDQFYNILKIVKQPKLY